jgi:hypothetical protein
MPGVLRAPERGWPTRAIPNTGPVESKICFAFIHTLFNIRIPLTTKADEAPWSGTALPHRDALSHLHCGYRATKLAK